MKTITNKFAERPFVFSCDFLTTDDGIGYCRTRNYPFKSLQTKSSDTLSQITQIIVDQWQSGKIRIQ